MQKIKTITGKKYNFFRTTCKTRGYCASTEEKRILITGSLGQIGTELVLALRKQYGVKNVIMTDVKKASDKIYQSGPFVYADVTHLDSLEKLIVDNKIDWLIHNAAILSAAGEMNPELAMKINVIGTENCLKLAHRHNLRVFIPSSIAAFGPTTPRDSTPNTTIMRPTTIYGVTKLYAELLGEFFHNRFGVDFRSLRYPGIISSETLPGGGTTDYAVDIFYHAILEGRFECFLEPESTLPMMYMPDCVKGTIQLITAPKEKILSKTYNLAAFSFSPRQLGEEIKKHLPHFQMEYKVQPLRQRIADSWPRSLDDTVAREEWGWKNEYDLSGMVKDMLEKLTPKLKDK